MKTTPDDDAAPRTTDPFSERRAFPEAAAVFTFKPPRLADTKQDCIVVLDTNVLLIPYTITAKTLGEIRRTYQSLVEKKQFVIPAQVAREFARHRAQKLGELFHQLTSKRSSVGKLQSGSYPLLEDVADYKRVRELEKEIDAKLSSYGEAVGILLATVRRWNWDDPVSLMYNELFSPSVVIDISITEEDLMADLQRRAIGKLPPGYKDAAKQANSAGDLVIWHTILEIGKTRKQPVLFVSGEEKSDWWHKGSGQALYPRYELIDEFRRASDGNGFFITQFSEFLELYGADKAVVDEVRKEEIIANPPTYSTQQSSRFIAALHHAEHAVGAWLRIQFSGCKITSDRTPGGIDYVVQEATGRRLGVDVKFFSQPRAFAVGRIVREMAYRAFYEIQAGSIDDYLLCIVTESIELAEEYLASLRRLVLRGPSISICVGVIISGSFSEVARVKSLGSAASGPPKS